jgi:ubiquinone/menaquinone biosynthesis C-methylase UbiE
MPLSPDQLPQPWGDIASAYEHSFEGLSSQFAADALRLLDVRPGERVIDVAAGTGAFSLLAARAGAEVLATDFAAGMVARLRERIAAEGLVGITAEVMDGQALAVPDASFDAGASVLGLIFFPDIARGLAEMRRVLRPGGRAAVVCWGDPRSLELMTSVVRAIQTVVPDYRPPEAPPAWARLAGAATLKDRMQAAGFSRVEVTTTTRSLKIASPSSFWSDFASSVPPLAYILQQLGPDRTAAVGRAYLESLVASSADGVPTLRAEACVGIGHAGEGAAG